MLLEIGVSICILLILYVAILYSIEFFSLKDKAGGVISTEETYTNTNLMVWSLPIKYSRDGTWDAYVIFHAETQHISDSKEQEIFLKDVQDIVYKYGMSIGIDPSTILQEIYSSFNSYKIQKVWFEMIKKQDSDIFVKVEIY